MGITASHGPVKAKELPACAGQAGRRRLTRFSRSSWHRIVKRCLSCGEIVPLAPAVGLVTIDYRTASYAVVSEFDTVCSINIDEPCGGTGIEVTVRLDGFLEL